ncbi:MAG: nitroreductase family protein [Alphaproteobacteria bacterium]
MSETLADLIEARFDLPETAGRDRAAEGAMAGLLRHRTHRRFTDAPVAEDLMRMLFACAFSAPSKSDLQQASVVRVRDAGKRRAIADLMPGMPWVGQVPEFMVFCGDGRRLRRLCAQRGREFANDTLDFFLNCATDTALAMQNFTVAAEAEGLGCCAISVLRDHVRVVSDILALPEGVFPYAGMCVGWPAREGFVSPRLPLAVTVHTDTYDDDALAAEIDAYDRRRDARYAIPAAGRKYVDDYGEADFYGWSEDKARQMSKPERADFGAYVRDQGFALD